MAATTDVGMNNIPINSSKVASLVGVDFIDFLKVYNSDKTKKRSPNGLLFTLDTSQFRA